MTAAPALIVADPEAAQMLPRASAGASTVAQPAAGPKKPSKSERFRSRWVKAIDILKAYPDTDARIASAELHQWLTVGRRLDADLTDEGLTDWRMRERQRVYVELLEAILRHVAPGPNLPRAIAVRKMLATQLKSRRPPRSECQQACANFLRHRSMKIPCLRKFEEDIKKYCL